MGVVNAPLSDTASFLPNGVAELISLNGKAYWWQSPRWQRLWALTLYVTLAPILIRSYIFLMPAAEAIPLSSSVW